MAATRKADNMRKLGGRRNKLVQSFIKESRPLRQAGKCVLPFKNEVILKRYTLASVFFFFNID